MGLREMIPASSRSFWQLYGEVEQLRASVNTLQEELQSVKATLANDRRNEASQALRMDLMMWETMRREGETILDAKKRFFKNMAPAKGGMRLLQRGCAQLLREFDDLCAQHNIPYWIAFGTLLGAVRHDGFIPWDDDTDLCIMREDLLRLQDLVKESNRFRVTVVYDRHAHCRQVRFCYKDPQVPCFLDLFIFDYTVGSGHDMFERMTQMRHDMIASMDADEGIADWNKSSRAHAYVAEPSDLASRIAQRFDAAVEAMHAQDNLLAASREEALGIMWSIDNLFDLNKYDWICSVDDIFPLQRLTFEGVECNAPANYMKFLDEVYGDLYTLPKDLGQHFEHMSHSGLEDPEVMVAMRRILNDVE